jgi:hypothetical protein
MLAKFFCKGYDLVIMETSPKEDRKKEMLFQEGVMKELLKHGPLGQATWAYIHQRKVKIKFNQQKHSSAAWTLAGNIRLNLKFYSVETYPGNPGMLSLIVHEVHHLRQGFLTALSVYGELDAWQLGFRFYRDLTGSQFHPSVQELLSLPLGFSRMVLKQAAGLMKTYSPGYRIDLLPLYPLPREIAWWLTKKEPSTS